jgi:hypothetical protein
MKLDEIASRINAHLKRFEADPKINVARGGNLRPYYYAGAHRRGRFVGVRYVSFQGVRSISKADAERYLAWLDAGNEGRHHEALRQGLA